jgi:hypothetical protein
LDNFVSPSNLYLKSYPEKQLIDDQKTGNCLDIYTLGLNNINSYLKGEKVESLTIDGNRPDEDELEFYDLPPVPPEEARKRLVFFVEQHDGEYKPICYNLDMIEKSDLMSNIYSTSCGADGSLANILNGLGDPIFKLNLGDFSAHVHLKQLLGALYTTKKQVFILKKTNPTVVYPRTASLTAIFSDEGAWVSSDHCQEGSDKTLYEILLCEEKDGNLCYPILESNDIEEIGLSEFEDLQDMTYYNRISILKEKIFKLQRSIKIAEYNISSIENKPDSELTCQDDYVYGEDGDDEDGDD